MPADHRSLLIAKLRFGSLEGPRELSVRSCLANVDLCAQCVHLQYHFLAGRRFDFFGHIGTSDLLPVGLRSDSDQKGGLKHSCEHGHKFNIAALNEGQLRPPPGQVRRCGVEFSQGQGKKTLYILSICVSPI